MFVALKDWVSKTFSRSQAEFGKQPNIGEDIRQVVRTKRFESTLEALSPFLLVSIIAWPAVWIYKGLEWPSRSRSSSLPIYIRQTYYQAKLLQFAIVLTGLMVIISQNTLGSKLVKIEETSTKK